MKSVTRSLALALVAGALALPLHAQLSYKVTVQNLGSATPTGLYHSPVWLGFHNGSFDLFNSGSAASAGLEALAELGDSSGIAAAFAAAQPSGLSMTLNDPAGPGPGIFAPGRSRSATVTLNATNNRYLSFGAMIVPSNDSFVANGNPLALELFDASGHSLGAQSWTFTGANVWDAGTEQNDPMNGAAFVAGVDAMLGTSEGGVVHLQPLDGLDNVIGLETPAGTTIGRALTDAPLFRISITPVPEPSTYGAIAAAALLGLVWWRRTRRNVPVAVRA
ncbi:spondin domain-containing protein [Opitutus terrae]|uniref:Ice-binding protein C-terminal domain-containing protein n=1 Tax=Opitutus terrae (strain DSM 11246 / JCM 15787 / PB90-1) TaxID=452637 RepID=B1ZYF5_OPITP|nr:spondin domain-containing protein [Opitutus terrae]ACB77053.1 hypothetical protein Oter_3778 [Opitutus terrae PB90-1]